jgi:hypothetical protein
MTNNATCSNSRYCCTGIHMIRYSGLYNWEATVLQQWSMCFWETENGTPTAYMNAVHSKTVQTLTKRRCQNFSCRMRATGRFTWHHTRTGNLQLGVLEMFHDEKLHPHYYLQHAYKLPHDGPPLIQFLIYKIWGFHGSDYEKWRLLGCYAAWLLQEPTFRSNLAPP